VHAAASFLLVSCLTYSSTLTMGAINSFETPVNVFGITLLYNPGDYTLPNLLLKLFGTEFKTAPANPTSLFVLNSQ
jgi:hypothetical protein